MLDFDSILEETGNDINKLKEKVTKTIESSKERENTTTTNNANDKPKVEVKEGSISFKSAEDYLDNRAKEKERKLEDKGDEEFIKKLEESTGFAFSEQQLKVIREGYKPMNVVACAGAGKSSVLINKINYMENIHKIPPSRVLAISFNKEAVSSLEGRYKEVRHKLGLSTIVKPTFSTFHALFYKLLRRERKYSSLKILNEKAYMYNLLKKVKGGNNDEGNKRVLEKYLNLRGRLINEGFSKLYQSLIDGDYSTYGLDFLNEVDLENFALVMNTYESLKEGRGEIDFEDMQLMLYNELIVEENEEIPTLFQTLYDRVLIDEYQDINTIQIKIMDKLIGDKIRGLTTVGDADQSIYGFRGSDPKYITNFTLNYKDSVRHFLGYNYRCKSNILNAVIPLIENNNVRLDYDMKAYSEGGEVHKVVGDDDKFVALLEKDIKKEDEETVILVRLNMQQKVLADILTENDIDVSISNENSTIRRDVVYRDIIELIQGIKYDDAEIMSMLSGKVFPYIKKEVWREVIDFGLDWKAEILENEDYKIPYETRKNIYKLKEVTKAKNMILLAYQLMSMYYRRASEKGYVSLRDVEIIVKHMHKTSYELSLSDYQRRERLKEQKIQDNREKGIGIKVQTIHSVKGLEYDNVYLYGLERDIIPDERRLKTMTVETQKEYIEEERRLFYVGWTRAKNKLVYHYSSEDKKSMFISELDTSKVIED